MVDVEYHPPSIQYKPWKLHGEDVQKELINHYLTYYHAKYYEGTQPLDAFLIEESPKFFDEFLRCTLIKHLIMPLLILSIPIPSYFV